jgi:hypothetical protein
MDGTGGSSSPFGDPNGTAKDHCLEIPRLAQAPVLDGFVEDGIFLQEVDPQGWRHPSEPIPPGTRMLFGAAWRPDGVYFFAVVEDLDRMPAPLPEPEDPDDRNVWKGDGVEFYFDHDGVFDAALGSYALMGTRQIIIAAPANDDDVTTRASVRRSDGGMDNHAEYDLSLWISKPIPGGYVVEAFVDAATLNLAGLTLSENDTVGLNIGHNVSGADPDEGNRLSQYFLQVRDPLQGDVNDYPFRNESTFCQASLIVE